MEMAKHRKAPAPEEVKLARVTAGLTHQECANRFGYELRSWQKKEEDGNSARALSIGEFEFLLLLAGDHPAFELKKKRRQNFPTGGLNASQFVVDNQTAIGKLERTK